MKKMVHKNQVIITTLALLFAVVGYVSYDYKSGKEQETAEANAELENMDYAMVEDTEEVMNPGETVLTSSLSQTADYSAEVKLNREQVRSKNKEALLSVINDEAIPEEQKQNAINQMVAITELAEKEADAEMLLEAKGFTNVVVSISEESCDVVLDMGEVTDAKRAQVEDIVKRKTGVAAEKIVITTLNAAQKQAEETSLDLTEELDEEKTADLNTEND